MNSKDMQIIKYVERYCREIKNSISRFGDFAIFEKDDDYFKSVGMSLLQIGELCNDLLEDFKTANANIPWKMIRGMRNVYAHKYGTIDKAVVWNTINDDIPVLLSFCREIIESKKEGN